jgi:sterol desaturase/sphingolipid hydroxylase (fatty acid hydroxylase superfamily)
MNVEERLQKIEERNARVESDKAWETSWVRRGLLILFTYLAIGIYMWAIGITNPWPNAIVPAVGFLLSTLTMPFFKKMWLKKYGR